jgi:hypothetical protein
MSAYDTLTEIDRMVTGIEVQEAVDLVVAYILKTQKLSRSSAAHAYWNSLFEDEKIDILRKALVER